MGPRVWGLSSPFPPRKQSCMWHPSHKPTCMCRNMWEHTCDCKVLFASASTSLSVHPFAVVMRDRGDGGDSPPLFACCSGFMPLALCTLKDVRVYYPYSPTLPSGRELKSGRLEEVPWRTYYQENPNSLSSHGIQKTLGLVKDHMLAKILVPCHRNICTHPGLPGILTQKTPAPNKHKQSCGHARLSRNTTCSLCFHKYVTAGAVELRNTNSQEL